MYFRRGGGWRGQLPKVAAFRLSACLPARLPACWCGGEGGGGGGEEGRGETKMPPRVKRFSRHKASRSAAASAQSARQDMQPAGSEWTGE